MTRVLALVAFFAATACHRSNAAPHSPHSPPAPASPAAAQPGAHHGKGDLVVVVNGKPATTWTQAQLQKAASTTMTNQNGEQREGWALKPLTQSLVGGKARIVAVASDEERVPIDEKSWNDASRSLVLRMNHHGEYKAIWVDAAGNADEAFLKGVRRIEVVQ